jgi:hypothetical protein
VQAAFPEKETARTKSRPRRLIATNYLLAAPLEVSVPLAPPEVPEVEPPLGALELALSELGAVPPVVLEPYCFMQSSRSVPVMPMHWLGMRSLAALPALDGSLVLGELVPEPLVDVP